MQNSKIEWTDKTWNPVTGCTKVSQGCKNCYAEKIYERFNGKGSFKNVIVHEDRLMQPLRWKQPAKVFVNSMSDLFHEDVPFLFIYAVLRVMNDVRQHTYQVLTKRPERMIEFFRWKSNQWNFPFEWQPSSNVWIGVSVENQKAADERIPLLLQVPAAVKFLSCEPMLGPVDLSPYLLSLHVENHKACHGVHWVICGGESGHKARPMHPDWARSLRDQCNTAGVPFFFKQWGAWAPYRTKEFYSEQHPLRCFKQNGEQSWVAGDSDTTINHSINYSDSDCPIEKVGKKKSGRLLDGKEWNEMPVMLP